MADLSCARQRLLPEVGAEGQQRLARTPAAVASGPGADVSVKYLRAAGVLEVACRGSAPQFPHRAHLRYAAPTAVAVGAWAALQHVRRVLRIS